MAVGDVALGSSGLGFSLRSGSWRPPAGRGVVGADAFEILLCISPPQGSRMGPPRRQCGTVVSSCRLYLAVYRIVALSAVSGTNFRLPCVAKFVALFGALRKPGRNAHGAFARLYRREHS